MINNGFKSRFSNMHPMDEPLKYQDWSLPTAEHFYQLCKVPKDSPYRARIATADSPYEAKSMGNTNKLKAEGSLREDWSRELSLQVMEYILRYKYQPGTFHHNVLMKSGSEELVEDNSWHDNFWGVCKCRKCPGTGENNLGKLLMKLRDGWKALNSPLTTISVIGTAGRKPDGDKMTAELYRKMQLVLLAALNNICPVISDRHLISGGAAWADHLAVDTYLKNHSQWLTMYLPAPMGQTKFVSNDHPIRSKDPGAVANYYHKLFCEKLGRDAEATTMDINTAEAMGAKLIVHDGFFKRNEKVAQSDWIIAFTWGDGDEPCDGGTRHTWEFAKTQNKIHIPLHSLL